MFELGRLQLRADMTGIYRMALRVLSPAFVAARIANIYGLYTRNCGTLRTALEQPGRMDILVEGRPFPSDAFYQYLRGTTYGVVELTGVKRLEASIVEGGGDATRCLFRLTWAP